MTNPEDLKDAILSLAGKVDTALSEIGKLRGDVEDAARIIKRHTGGDNVAVDENDSGKVESDDNK